MENSMQLPKLYAQNISNNTIDLTLSVNPLGCSPRVLQALRVLTSKDLSAYPDTTALTKTIAQRFSIKPENILLGNGSEQLIKLISQTCINPGNQVTIENGSFAVFSKETMLAGGNVVLSNFEDIPQNAPRLVFIANPKTPTGELISQVEIQRIQKSIPGILVVDEANGEFIDKSSIPLAMQCTNLLVLRTFSKAFGIAGVRIGCAIGNASLIAKLAEAQQAFPVSQMAINMAVAALSDRQFLTKTRTFIRKERSVLSKALTLRSLTVSRSVTNNLFIEYSRATKLIEELNIRGVSVINGTFFPGMKKPGFRISIKTRKINRLFLQKLDEALACLNKKKLLPSKEIL